MFIMTPNVTFKLRNHVEQVCAAKQHTEVYVNIIIFMIFHVT